MLDVGVVTWNTRDLTVDALARLLQADGAGLVQRLLVHDNASDDGTAAAVRAGIPRAEVVVADDNLGFAAGMNRLIERSSAPWFLALNSDAWPDPGALDQLLRSAHGHPLAAALAPRLERPDGGLEPSTHPFPSVAVAAASAVGLHHLLQWGHGEPRAVEWAVGAALLMRRAAIDEIGGFDESFFMYAEDMEWCWRARRAGWEIWFEPAAVVRHVGDASGAKRFGTQRSRVVAESSYRFYRRTHGRISTTTYRALNIAGCLRLAGAARLRGDTAEEERWRREATAHLGR